MYMTSPSSPSWMAFFAWYTGGLKRLWKPVMSVTPASLTALMIALQSSSLVARGFSHRICLPA